MKDFDIYLQSRIKEYRVVVSSFKFKEFLSYADRLILSSCIEFCELQMIIKGNSNVISTELEAEIVDLLEECYFLLNSKFEMWASADFNQVKLPKIRDNKIELNSELKPLLGLAFLGANSVIELGISPIPAGEIKEESFIRGSIATCVDIRGLEISEENFLKIHPDAVEIHSKIDFSDRYFFTPQRTALTVDETVDELTEIMNTVASTATNIVVYPVEAGVSFSLGKWLSKIELGVSETSFWEEVFEVYSNGLLSESSIAASLTVNILQACSAINLSQKILRVTEVVHNKVGDALQLLSEVIGAEITHSLGRWENVIDFDSVISKSSAESFVEGTSNSILASKVKGTSEETFESLSRYFDLDAKVEKLLLLVGFSSELLAEISSEIIDARLDLSIGRMSTETRLESDVSVMSNKYSDVNTAISLLCEIKNNLISEFGVNSGISLNLDMSALTKRYAVLSDYDEKTLEELDNFSLADLDYIVLEG